MCMSRLTLTENSLANFRKFYCWKTLVTIEANGTNYIISRKYFICLNLPKLLEQRLGVTFDEYHGEAMYFKKSLQLLEEIKDKGLLQYDRFV